MMEDNMQQLLSLPQTPRPPDWPIIGEVRIKNVKHACFPCDNKITVAEKHFAALENQLKFSFFVCQ